MTEYRNNSRSAVDALDIVAFHDKLLPERASAKQLDTALNTLISANIGLQESE